MITNNRRLLDVLGESDTAFVIPAYQRAYAWEQRQCEELWRDLMRAGSAEKNHFIGTLLCSDKGEDESGIRRFAVVDGQQRLTTVTLVLLSLCRYLEEKGVALSDTDAFAITQKYLRVGPPCASIAKLQLSRNDRQTLIAELDGEALPEQPSARVVENLAFFCERTADEDFDPQILWQGLQHLCVITAQTTEQNNAQLIFESLNSKGVPLSTADLVRNYLLLAQTHEERTRLYDQYWAPIEGMFVPDPGSLRLDNAIQGWLSVRFRKVRAKGSGEVYSVFKRYVEEEYTGTTEGLLNELKRFSLVWAENYRYHAVKKYKSASNWAQNGPMTLVSGTPVKEASNPEYAKRVREGMARVDEKQ